MATESSEDNEIKRQQVFVRDEDLVWAPAEVLERGPSQTMRVRLTAKTANKHESFVVKLREYRGLELPKFCPTDSPDLTELEHIHEASILHTLKDRNAAGKPYTRSSTATTIAVNPFEWHEDLYSKATRQRYAQELVWKKYDEKRSQLEPHIYEVSSRAYAELMMERRNQCILVTGESGSGKTESAKIMLHHIAEISGTKGKIVKRILDSHPCLEAFGNAVTIRNDNSSRFAKFLQLQFDASGSVPVLAGSSTWQFLLETTRVCEHSAKERSFHIFYQLLACPTKATYCAFLREKTVESFRYLAGSSEVDQIEGLSDAARFDETVQALRTCKVDVNMLIEAICVTLQLGNLTFGTNTEDNDRTEITSQEELQALSKLMGIPMDELTTGLTERTMKTVLGETFKVPLSAEKCQEACDALAKELYSKAFQWLVQTINKGTKAVNHEGTIGLLDIFGFESFETNRFEQLCINYANEKLQQKAANDIFRKTKEEYDREGIYLKQMEFDDNERVLDSLEGKTTGVMALLNEQCLLPSGGSNRAFVQRVLEQHKNSKYIVGPSHKRFTSEFGILHYAGLVMYQSDGFVERNKDSLPLDLKNCIKKSSNGIVAFHADDPPPAAYLPAQEEEHCCSTTSLLSFASTTFISEDVSGSIASDMSTNSMNMSNRCSVQERINFLSEKQKIGPQRQQTKPPLVLQNSSLRPPSSFHSKKDSPFSTVPRFNTTRQQSLTSKPGPKIIRASSSFSDTNGNRKEFLHRTRSAPMPNSSNGSTVQGTRPTKALASELSSATVWSKYQEQLTSLIDMLNQTKSRYVRCIKPNPQRQPRVTDLRSTVGQLRCSGLVNITKLSRATYSTSLPNRVLRFRYKSMWNQELYPSKAKRMDKADRKYMFECEALLSCALGERMKEYKHGGKNNLPYAVGKTRTYSKKGILEFLEESYVLELDSVVAVIQKRIRGILTRKRQAEIRRAATFIREWYRRSQAKRKAYLDSVGGQRRRFLEARRIFDRNRPFQTLVVRVF